jgi:hypothetical protein
VPLAELNDNDLPSLEVKSLQGRCRSCETLFVYGDTVHVCWECEKYELCPVCFESFYDHPHGKHQTYSYQGMS